MALQNYYYVYADCKPKRDALVLSNKQIEETEKNLVEKRELLSALQEELAVLREHYTSKEEQCRRLQGEIDQCTLHNGRAAKLLHSLKAEKQKWTVLNRLIMDKFINLEGDCLLAAAIIVYLSPLT